MLNDAAHNEKVFWLAFSLIPGIGIKRIRQIHSEFGNLANAWTASDKHWQQTALDKRTISLVTQRRKQIKLEHEIERVRKTGAQLITPVDPDYPPHLAALDDTPPVLYVLGSLSDRDRMALAMVGTRSATRYGRETASSLARQLALQGVTIISGLAQGIDTAAHKGCLDAGGRTLAVLGCGIDRIYPVENSALARKVIENGALISEFPIGTPPDGRNFPRRNRIISGLSLGVLVVEAPENSGALITATLAAEQGKDVFAVPANIYNPKGTGANRLIQDGAKLVMEVEDILCELNITYSNHETRVQAEAIQADDPTEIKILGYLSMDPIHIDEIARLSGLPVATVSSTLTILELKGLAQLVGPMQYSLPYP